MWNQVFEGLMCNKTPDQALAAFSINFHFVAV